MDTNGIRLFVLAADLLNISSAGRQLGLAPSVASARLSKLEVQLGADLFHRSTRKVTLSTEGAEFLPYAREILAQEDAALAALGKGSSNVSGTLRFAASSTFVQRFVAPILPEFLERYPGVNVELKLSDTQVNLIEGGFDLALRNYAVEDSSLIGRKLAEDKRILCASPSYLKKYGAPNTPEDLIRHQLLVFMNSKPRKLISESDKQAGSFPPPKGKSRVICDDGASMRIAAKAGVGVCMSSLWNIYSELEEGTLVRVLPDYRIDDQAAIWLVYPKSNVLTSKVRVFIDFLVEKIGISATWANLKSQ
ncbi:LysR family transcriptional regulator [Microbulbifer sp. TRSA005]|uniref:LysR family transcriptional regulator n=1 Tax=Microbulbifer sp. TRSA005 TaxID=3243383 RepID=UPI00403A31DE